MNSSARPFSPIQDGACPPPDGLARWTLAAKTDQEDLVGLQSFLAEHRDRPVRIDAAALRRPDSLLLQLLVAACRDWAARGLCFEVVDLPERVVGLLPLLGLRPDMIGIEAR